MAEIPSQVLAALNRGEMPTRTLVELLAIDHRQLARSVCASLQVPAVVARSLQEAAEALASEGIMKRMQGQGAALALALPKAGAAGAVCLAQLAGHPSDVIRSWANFAITSNPAESLANLLPRVLPFAIDDHFGVRECAWMSLRPAIAADVPQAIMVLQPWIAHRNPFARRCAVEGTRPRGVWCAHLPTLKQDPAQGLPLLKPLQGEPDKYVQTSIANWLNDAGKTQPEWLRQLAQDWRAASSSPHTAAILKHACRNLKPA